MRRRRLKSSLQEWKRASSAPSRKVSTGDLVADCQARDLAADRVAELLGRNVEIAAEEALELDAQVVEVLLEAIELGAALSDVVMDRVT